MWRRIKYSKIFYNNVSAKKLNLILFEATREARKMDASRMDEVLEQKKPVVIYWHVVSYVKWK